MSKYIDFNVHSRDYVPEHMHESVENYLMFGYSPGGFMEAMFAGDMFKAAAIADSENGPAMQGIAFWIMNAAPPGSWGSYSKVRAWSLNLNQCRAHYADKLEKEYIVRTLMA